MLTLSLGTTQASLLSLSTDCFFLFIYILSNFGLCPGCVLSLTYIMEPQNSVSLFWRLLIYFFPNSLLTQTGSLMLSSGRSRWSLGSAVFVFSSLWFGVCITHKWFMGSVRDLSRVYAECGTLPLCASAFLDSVPSISHGFQGCKLCSLDLPVNKSTHF